MAPGAPAWRWRANGDGTITVSSVTGPSGGALRWREIEPFVWRQEHGKELLSARAENGKIVRFGYGDEASNQVYDRTPWAKSAGWWVPAMGVSVMVLLLSALACPIGTLTRRHYGVAHGLRAVEARSQRWLGIAAFGAPVVFLAWVMLLVSMLANFELIAKVNGWLVLLHALSPPAFIGGVAMGVWNAWIVGKSERGGWAKAWAFLVVAAFMILLWAALAFHLIAFKTGF